MDGPPERINVGHKTRFVAKRSLEQAMTPQQALMNDALSLHTPSPLPADADATVTGTDTVYFAGLRPQPIEWLWQHRLAAGLAPKTENQVPGGGLCPIRRIVTSGQRGKMLK
jgi:hypothetical protein